MACEGADLCGFLDGTLRKNSRPGGEPGEDLQREIFDGHHRSHGLIWQSLVFPNGMMGDLYGPVAGRRHDAYVLSLSELNPRLQQVMQGWPRPLKVYGDAAYPILSHVDRGFRGANLSQAQRAYNRALSRVRISVEWQFGKVVQMFPFVDFSADLNLLLQPIAKYYLVAALLTNAHTTCYGSITSKYFNCFPPTLEEYFGVS